MNGKNKSIKKVSLILHYSCNNNCLFCYSADKSNKHSLSTGEAKDRIRNVSKNSNLKRTHINFSGGEPTLRKDLPELISFARDLGFRERAITTNGTILGAYPEKLDRLLEAGLNHAIVSIHGANKSTHDSLTRNKGSFSLVNNLLDRLSKENIYVCSNTVMTKQNLDQLRKIAELSVGYEVDSMEFIFPHPKGNSLLNFSRVVPDLDKVRDSLSPLLELVEDLGLDSFRFRYLPLCVAPEKYISEVKQEVEERHFGPDFEDRSVERNRRQFGRTKLDVCERCKKRDMCEGVFKEYAYKRGDKGLVPYD